MRKIRHKVLGVGGISGFSIDWPAQVSLRQHGKLTGIFLGRSTAAEEKTLAKFLSKSTPSIFEDQHKEVGLRGEEED